MFTDDLPTPVIRLQPFNNRSFFVTTVRGNNQRDILADRLFRSPGLFRGAVVDFVDLRWWPVFNVADAAITVGCVALVLLSMARPGHER